MTEHLTEFEPSENQVHVLSAFQLLGYLCTVTEACQAADVSRQAWYQWFEQPGFNDWWRVEAEKWFSRQLPRVQACLVDAATSSVGPSGAKYNPKAIELFLQRFDKGFVPASRQVNEVSVGVRNFDKRAHELLAAYVDDDSEGSGAEQAAAPEVPGRG